MATATMEGTPGNYNVPMGTTGNLGLDLVNFTDANDVTTNESIDMSVACMMENNRTVCYNMVDAEKHYLMTRHTVVVLGYVAPLSVFFTLITNTLVCVVLLRKNMRTPTNTMLVAMAIADMLTGIWSVPCSMFLYTFGNYKEWVPYDWCFLTDVFSEYLPTVFHTASIWLTVSLAVQRYIYVCHSFKAKRWCTIPTVLKVIIGIYVTSMCTQIVRFMEKVYIPVDKPSKLDPNKMVVACAYRLSSLIEANSYAYYNTYYWFRILFNHAVPCTTLVILNVLLINTLHTAQVRRQILLKQNRNTESRKLKESNCTTLMLVVVVGVFLLVEVPMAICFILLIIGNNWNILTMNETSKNEANLFINLFILLSYPINFFIYCGMSRQFRETFKRLFKPGAAPMDREHSQYMSLATENGGKTLNTHETTM